MRKMAWHCLFYQAIHPVRDEVEFLFTRAEARDTLITPPDFYIDPFFSPPHPS
jgi:hypothetical protein